MLWFFGFITSYLASRALNWPLIYGIAIVAGLYMLSQSGVGPASAVGGAVGAVTSAVGTFFKSLWRLAVGLVFFVGLMLLANRLTGVGFDFVGLRFQALGVAVWGWPAHIDLAVLLFVSVAFVMAGIAARAANDNPRPAMTIFGVSAVVISIMMYLPNYSATYPTAVEVDDTLVKKGGVTRWAEDKGGVIPVVVDTTTRVGFGKPDPKHGFVGGNVRRGWEWAFGPPAPKAQPVAYVPPPPPPPPEFPTHGEGHAKKDVGLKAEITPGRTQVVPSGPAKYIFAEDTSLFYEDRAGHKMERDADRLREWKEMPAGRYIVYPLDRDDIFVRWK